MSSRPDLGSGAQALVVRSAAIRMLSGGRLALVGRDDVLADVDSVLETARGRRGSLVLVTGEAGIGKTRLAEEAARRAADFTVVWSWCASEPTAASFTPWVHIVRELATAQPEVARSVAQSPHLRDLVWGTVPDGGVGIAPSAHATLADPEAARALLFDSMADLLRLASASRPLLIILDDLHDARESSQWLLAHLAPMLRSMPAVILATAREGEHAWHGRPAARAAILRQSTSLTLAPLGTRDVARLVDELSETPLSPDVVEQVIARTSGNPLLVAELVRVVRARPLDADRVLRSGVPDSVRALAAERVLGFTPSCRRLLSAASVIGSRFALDVLADVADVELGHVREDLFEAERSGMLALTEPATGHFVHALIRDGVYEALLPAERSRWHTRAAVALARLYERGRAIDPAEVAHHFLLAGPAAADRAAEYTARAGDRAASVLAFEDAVRWYETSLVNLDLGDAPVGQRARLHVALAEARLGCGDGPGARSDFLKAAALAREAGVFDRLALAALGLGSGAAGFEVGLLDREQLDLLEEARQNLDEHQVALRALVTARLSVAATFLESAEQRLVLAEQSLSLARQADDDAAQAYALAALCDALAGPDSCQVRLKFAAESVERAVRARNPALELLGRRLRLLALLETGDRSAAEAEMLAFRARAESFRHPLYGWYVSLWRGMWALAEGRLEECRAHNELADVEGRAAHSENAFLLVTTQRWCLLVELAEWPGLRDLFASVDFEQQGGVWARINSALVHAQLGDTASARRRLDAVAAQIDTLPRDSEWLPSMAQIAETVSLVGPHAVARPTYAALQPYAGLFAIEGIGAAVRGPISRFLGILAKALGDHAAAQAHFSAALAEARRFGAPLVIEHIEREAATPGAPAPVADDNTFSRQGAVWTLRFAGREVQLRDSKGMRDIAALLAQPGSYVAALDLASVERPRGSSTARPIHGISDAANEGLAGDAGEVLDDRARAAYRQRLIDLEDDARTADAAADVELAGRIADEREALIEQLTAAYGLGGRQRRAKSVAERARTAVTARIRDAIRHVEHVHPALGRHLGSAVRTGTFCTYQPEVSTRWHV